MTSTETEEAVRRRTAITDYRKRLLQHKELDSRVRSLRENLRGAKKEFGKTEDDLKSLQSVGQIIGEVLRPLDNERLIVKASSGPRYVVGCRSKVDKEKLTAGTRVVLDMTTLTIMRALPREVVSSAIIDEYIGESARLMREMFGYAHDYQIDAIGGRRFSEGTSADREIQ